ncbi:MAG: rod shape-determining protein MreD [Nitrospirae bacterium]|nr:rod shape-determining protein MreD [Nitrospirota bacterium]MBI5695442.1 rod shape-determining protein MreD [Nitrospirota bacterium]
MKFRVPLIFFLLASAVLQVTVVDWLSLWGVRPNLILVAVYALSITGGEMRGIMYGALGGIVMDCLSGGMMGLFLSGYALVGYLAGRAGRRVFNISEVANFGGIFAISLVQGAYSAVVMSTFINGYDAWAAILGVALPQSVYTACAGVLMLWLFRKRLADMVPWLGLAGRRRAGA